MVACFGGEEAALTGLARAVDALRWHHGKAGEHRCGALSVVCQVDPVDGPTVEQRDGAISIVHGTEGTQLETLQAGTARFAALVYDGARLRASRDIFGHVPLFYRRFGDAVWFSTEIPPLVALGDAAPDLRALAAYAATVEYSDRTGWEGIYRVLPGETLEVRKDLRATSARYWNPQGPRDHAEIPYTAVTERFRELMHRAVERRLPPKAGVVLSGGLDSSAVAVLAARVGQPSLLSVTYPSLPEVDETQYAAAVADAAGFELHSVEGRLDPWDPTEELQTFGVPPVMLPTGVFDSALGGLAELGCDVALDGHDGDGVLGNSHSEISNTLLDGRPLSLAPLVREYGWGSILRGTIDELVPPAIQSDLLRRPAKRTVADDFLPYFREPVHSRLVEKYRWRPPREGWREEQRRVFLPPATQIIEETELLGSKFGIDVQHPFADRDLITFLVSLPHRLKVTPEHSKRILRDALADLIPDMVLNRTDKAEFSAVTDRRVDYEKCFTWVRDSGARLPDIDYGRLFRDASRPQNNRVLWSRLARVHLFVAGA